MSIEIDAGLLTDVASEAGIYDSDVRFSYSGRGMYGDNCFGIVGSTVQLIDFVKAISSRVTDGETELEDFYYDQLSNVKTDSMGYDNIFYWENVTASGAEMLED